MTASPPPLDHWEPLTPPEAADVLCSLHAPWWIAGGYAIEAFVDGYTRQHADLDIGVLRVHQADVREILFAGGWFPWAADPPGALRPWLLGETLPLHVHDIWVSRGGQSPYQFQLMLDESDGADWVYRRDPRVRRPLASLLWKRGGIAFIAPEVQLLYKSKSPRPKDEQDFLAALPHLDSTARNWLRAALSLDNADHPWLPMP